MSRTKRIASIAAALIAASATASAGELPLSVCSPITVAAVHPLSAAGAGDPFPANQRLALIESGIVPCMHSASFEIRSCAFQTDASAAASGHWLEDKHGRRFAPVGQLLTEEGGHGGPYLVASRLVADTVPCVGASGYDTAGVLVGEELAGACVLETMGSAANVTGKPLVNFATIPVCTSSTPHPDGAKLVSADDGVYCYIGEGAGLNDSNGRERDERGLYLPGAAYCHVGFNSGYEVPAAKRPATKGGWPKKVDVKSPILWRPYVSSVKIAN